MSYQQRLLADDEELVLHQHPHWKVLVLPMALVPLVVGIAAFGIAAMPQGSMHNPGRYAVLGVALVLVFAFSFLPWLRWRTTHFILTNRRIVVRSGVLSRSGRDIPLARVNDVTFSHTLIERMFRCGTLVVESGGERGQLVLPDVPEVEQVQRRLSELVEASLEVRGGRPPGQRDPAGETDADVTLTGE